MINLGKNTLNDCNFVIVLLPLGVAYHNGEENKMAKKIILGLALALVVAGGVFAQEGASGSAGIKNWISGEVNIFGPGVRYEHMLTDKMSIGANAYWSTTWWRSDFEVGASFRYYVWKQLLFVGGGLGFHMNWGRYKYKYGYGYDYDYDYYDYDYLYYGYYGYRGASNIITRERGHVIGVAITPDVGFRIDVGDAGGFFLSPGIKVPITLGAYRPTNYSWLLGEGNRLKSQFKVGVGVVAYLGLGYAW